MGDEAWSVAPALAVFDGWAFSDWKSKPHWGLRVWMSNNELGSMLKEIDYRIGFAVLFLLVVGGHSLVAGAVPGLWDYILIAAIAVPGLVPRRFVWIALGLSALLTGFSFGYVLVSWNEMKAPQAYAIGFLLATVAFLGAAYVGFSRQMRASIDAADPTSR